MFALHLHVTKTAYLNYMKNMYIKIILQFIDLKAFDNYKIYYNSKTLKTLNVYHKF